MKFPPFTAALFLASPMLFSQTEEAPAAARDTGERVRPAAEVPA
ncbi:hypothetical protein N8813_01440 [bacterium]|nr:hypothetical protein [bacterium]